jgi:hypothetical protein
MLGNGAPGLGDTGMLVTELISAILMMILVMRTLVSWHGVSG